MESAETLSELRKQDSVVDKTYELGRAFYEGQFENDRNGLIKEGQKMVGAYGYLASKKNELVLEAQLATLGLKTAKNAQILALRAKEKPMVAKQLAEQELWEQEVDVALKEYKASQYDVFSKLSEKLISFSQTVLKNLKNEENKSNL